MPESFITHRTVQCYFLGVPGRDLVCSLHFSLLQASTDSTSSPPWSMALAISRWVWLPGSVCYLVLLSAVAFSLWTTLLKYNPAGRVAVFNFLIPLFGTVLSVLLLGEDTLQPRILGALVLVCAGIALVNYKKENKQ